MVTGPENLPAFLVYREQVYLLAGGGPTRAIALARAKALAGGVDPALDPDVAAPVCLVREHQGYHAVYRRQHYDFVFDVDEVWHTGHISHPVDKRVSDPRKLA